MDIQIATLCDFAADYNGKLVISGTFDTLVARASSAKNLELAKARAMTVRDALVADGIAAERITLVKPTDAIVGEGRDVEARRVDIVLR